MAVTENYDLERAYGHYLHTTEDAAIARKARLDRQEEPPTFHAR
jgi:hypothetical protein